MYEYESVLIYESMCGKIYELQIDTNLLICVC
jgi:hypothetical protein